MNEKPECPKHGLVYEQNPETLKMNFCRVCQYDKVNTVKAIKKSSKK